MKESTKGSKEFIVCLLVPRRNQPYFPSYQPLDPGNWSALRWKALKRFFLPYPVELQEMLGPGLGLEDGPARVDGSWGGFVFSGFPI